MITTCIMIKEVHPVISYIRGPLEEKREDSVVVEAGNIGYRIFIPSSVLGELPGLGEEVKIYTYFSVREDGMSLYGFLSKQDLEMFRQLIGVNGVGPKSALGILSALKPDVLRMAVLSGDAKAISKAPGVGAKTAQRIILDLKDKVKAEDVLFAGVEPEETGKMEIVALDKTGTITDGREESDDHGNDDFRGCVKGCAETSCVFMIPQRMRQFGIRGAETKTG